MIAITHGGLLPNGPGSGTSRNTMPHPESDMIYAFIIEEYGSIIGGIGLLWALATPALVWLAEETAAS